MSDYLNFDCKGNYEKIITDIFHGNKLEIHGVKQHCWIQIGFFRVKIKIWNKTVVKPISKTAKQKNITLLSCVILLLFL